jgi:hypothetical protein
MRTIMAIVLSIGLASVFCHAQESPDRPVVANFPLDAANVDDNMYSRSLTAETVQNGDSITIHLSAWNGDCSFSVTADRGSRVFLKDDGNLEWEITLSEPPSERLTYHIDTKGFTCHYQPPLTDEEILRGLYRPDSVAGSYAFYRE